MHRFGFENGGRARDRKLADTLDVWDSTIERRNQLGQLPHRLAWISGQSPILIGPPSSCMARDATRDDGASSTGFRSPASSA